MNRWRYLNATLAVGWFLGVRRAECDTTQNAMVDVSVAYASERRIFLNRDVELPIQPIPDALVT